MTAEYLDGRIQGNPDEMPGRAPDMSAGAATAMMAVLQELKSALPAQEAREEAGSRLRNNMQRVLQDVTNSSPTTNIDGKPLTQLELRRVTAPQDRPHVEAALNEVVRRLLGTPAQKPGRKPDMSASASIAMQEVLGQLR